MRTGSSHCRTESGHLAKRDGEAFGFLGAHDEAPFIEDHGGDAADSHFNPALFQRADGFGVAVVGEDFLRFGAVEAGGFDEAFL